MKKAQAWINKKIRSGVDPRYLKHTVGCWSNKKKSRVIKEKNLSSRAYDDRYKFLYKVYSILDRKY